MLISLHLIPNEIIEQYNLFDIAENGYIWFKIQKGMYGLPQAGQLAYDQLVQHLRKFGYHPAKYTRGLWRHDTCVIVFCLFGKNFLTDTMISYISITW